MTAADPGADFTVTIPAETGILITSATSGYGDISAVETITGNWVNTANPWADNEVADTLTVGASGSVDGGALSLLATGTGLTSSSSGL